VPTDHGGEFPRIIEVVVEIPRGSRNKYEYDERSGAIWLDRVLSSAVYYNFDYGYIAGTRSEDGDFSDALLLTTEATFPGCHVWARPVGGLEMTDEKGPDYKVLCVSLADPLFEHVDSLESVPPHLPREIEQFFATYKVLEDKGTEVRGWRGRDDALDHLRADREREEARLRAEQPAADRPAALDQ
jgi:inorganic pyrophosphatase